MKRLLSLALAGSITGLAFFYARKFLVQTPANPKGVIPDSPDSPGLDDVACGVVAVLAVKTFGSMLKHGRRS